MMIIEMDANAVDEYGHIPEPGETILWNDSEKIVLSTTVTNKSKVALKTHPKCEVKTVDDPVDSSVGWPELPENALDELTTE